MHNMNPLRYCSTYCGWCSFGLLSSSMFPRLGFLELEAAVSDGSNSSQLSEVFATVWPQRRRPLFSTPIPPLFSLPTDAVFCRSVYIHVQTTVWVYEISLTNLTLCCFHCPIPFTPKKIRKVKGQKDSIIMRINLDKTVFNLI